MQKTRKRSETSTHGHSAHAHRYPASLPEVVSVDVIGTMPDEDLIVRLRALDDDRNRVFEAHLDPRPWEEEIAYIRREQQIRRARRDEHQDYVRRMETEFSLAEFGLPAGDFDNSAYVYAATGGRPRWS